MRGHVGFFLLGHNSLNTNQEMKWKVLEIYQREMLRLSIGQATDIAWHKAMVTPESITESQYLEMAYRETGVLTGMAFKMGAAIGGAEDKAIEAMGKLARRSASLSSCRTTYLT